ncbi:hypothetical protein NYE40_04405 [Paenibacillus sp. FSL W8-1187]|uniref:hypothetical protein n=1 Tax=Paenibacillus sp. FSL W8-1187 TaxID=2975339 RepID=UPI0030DB4BFA
MKAKARRISSKLRSANVVLHDGAGSPPRAEPAAGRPEEAELYRPLTINFGSLALPPTLRLLQRWNESLGDSETFYGLFGFYLQTGGFRYANTPCDAVVFGSTGMDGIHFALLTDFGRSADLGQAPVICVSPMEFDDPSTVIARNLREFLSYGEQDWALFYNVFADERQWRSFQEKSAREQAESQWRRSDEEESRLGALRKQFLAEAGLSAMADGWTNLQAVRLERAERRSIPTADSLGVIEPAEPGWNGTLPPLGRDTSPDESELEPWLRQAPRHARLAAIRLLQHHGLSPALAALLADELQALGLGEDALRLLFE